MNFNCHSEERSQQRNLCTALLTAVICILVITPIVLCVWFVNAFGVDAPWYDHWDCVETLIHLHQGTLNCFDILLKQHNQHLVGVPFLLMSTLSTFTHFDMRAEMFASLPFLFLAAFALLQITKKRLPENTWMFAALIPITWLTCSLRQYESFLGGVMGGAECIMSSSFIVLTIYLLDQVDKVGFPLLFAMITSTCCVLSFGNGILVLPLSIMQLAMNSYKFSKKSLILSFWGLFSLVLFFIYFANYKTQVESGNFIFLKHHFISVVQYFLVYLGSPLVSSTDIVSAELTGLLLCTILLILLFTTLKHSDVFQNIMVLPIVLIIYTLLSDCLTALNRARFGLIQAMSSRYVSFSYLAIIGLYLFLLSAYKLRPLMRFSLLGILTAMIIVGTITTVEDGLIQGRSYRDRMLVLANLLYNYKLQDLDSLTPLAPMPATPIVLKLAPFLEKNHLSVFREQPTQKMWHPSIAPLVHIDGIISYPRQYVNGLFVFTVDGSKYKNINFSGWAIDRDSHKTAGGISICIDDKLDIPAAYGLDRPDIAKLLKRQSYHNCGFTLTCPTSVIVPGNHMISFKVFSPDKKGYYKTAPIALLKIYDL